MMPFFKLRSALATRKGRGREFSPVKSCWVMEALALTLAVTHLKKGSVTPTEAALQGGGEHQQDILSHPHKKLLL